MCELKPEALKPVSDWVEKNRKLWNERLDALEGYLNKIQNKE